MRQPPSGLDLDTASQAWKQQGPARATAWSSYPCKLVTPLYGGGVRPGEVDEAMPIRAAGLRGQLRFWWRLSCCESSIPAAAMFERESAIWGGIASSQPTASKVTVRVKAKPVTQQQLCEFRQLADFPAYALITEPNANPVLLRSDFSFQLMIGLDSKLDETQRKEVETALRWWASFGGIGARTRRGLGAVYIKGFEPVSSEEVAAKGGRLAWRAAEKNPQDAWKKAVDRLKAFRQGLNTGRNPSAPGSQSPAGRSLWPEADTLRELSGHALPKHATKVVQASLFPRAAFGLPIVFHFKDAPKQPSQRHGPMDPDDHILEPTNLSSDKQRDRMASPLIVRPYWTGKAWRPAALLIPGWEKAIGVPLKFKEQHYRPEAWPTESNEQAQLAAQIKPMAKRGNDPLSAFMAYFQET